MGCGSSTSSNSIENIPNSKYNKSSKNHRSFNNVKSHSISSKEIPFDLRKKSLSSTTNMPSINNNNINKLEKNKFQKSLSTNTTFELKKNISTKKITLSNNFNTNNKSLNDIENSKILTPEQDSNTQPLYSSLTGISGKIINTSLEPKKDKDNLSLRTELNLAHHLMNTSNKANYSKKEEDSSKSSNSNDRAVIPATSSPRNRFRLKRPKSPQMCRVLNFFKFYFDK